MKTYTANDPIRFQRLEESDRERGALESEVCGGCIWTNVPHNEFCDLPVMKCTPLDAGFNRRNVDSD